MDAKKMTGQEYDKLRGEQKRLQRTIPYMRSVSHDPDIFGDGVLEYAEARLEYLTICLGNHPQEEV